MSSKAYLIGFVLNTVKMGHPGAACLQGDQFCADLIKRTILVGQQIGALRVQLPFSTFAGQLDP
jgi:hypothetical protein